MKSDRGFSLVQLLILLALISIVAAIVVPNFMISSQKANEAVAIQGCRTISSAEDAYAAAHEGRYAGLPALIEEGLLDERYASGQSVSGYRFVPGDAADEAPPSSFGFVAVPSPGRGRYLFSVGPDGIVRWHSAAEGNALPAGVRPGDPVESSEPAADETGR